MSIRLKKRPEEIWREQEYFSQWTRFSEVIVVVFTERLSFLTASLLQWTTINSCYHRYKIYLGEYRKAGIVWLALLSISILSDESSSSQMGIASALPENVSKKQELENTAILWLKGEQQLEKTKGFLLPHLPITSGFVSVIVKIYCIKHGILKKYIIWLFVRLRTWEDWRTSPDKLSFPLAMTFMLHS